MDTTDHAQSKPLISLTDIKELVIDDITSTNLFIQKELSSNIPLIKIIIKHIINSGGKRIRPLLVILSAKACQYEKSSEHIELASIIEFVHTATLLHDDVVDHSTLRRGKKTANDMWGNSASVLVGDFLYSRAFQILTRRENMAVMNILSSTTNTIAEGEVMQLANRHNAELTEQDYLDVIYRKTAKLFESSSEIAAAISPHPEFRPNLKKYGCSLGMCFQIIDDILDYTTESDQLGKNTGDDLADGKITLPLIYAIHNSSTSEAKTIKDAIINADIDQLPLIQHLIKQTQSIDYCKKKAKDYAQQAISALTPVPNSPYKDALIQLTHIALTRKN